MKREYMILIVDDEREILKTYRDFLEKRNFKVDVALDGKQGLEKLRKIEFDLAIVDMKMPNLDGISMIRKTIEEGIDTDIIILTGHGGKEEAVEAINLGVSAWFEKQGIRMADLLSKIKELVEGVPLKEIRQIISAIPEEEFNKKR